MNETQFTELQSAVRMMGKHMRGQKIEGMRETELSKTDEPESGAEGAPQLNKGSETP